MAANIHPKYVPSLVKIYWMMLILECSQGCYTVKIYPVNLTFDLWPWKSTEFQTLLRTKHVPSLVKIHRRMLILECSQGCYAVKKLFDPVTLTFDLWHWKSIGFHILLRTKYVPSLVKIHWRMLILECSLRWRGNNNSYFVFSIRGERYYIPGISICHPRRDPSSTEQSAVNNVNCWGRYVKSDVMNIWRVNPVLSS